MECLTRYASRAAWMALVVACTALASCTVFFDTNTEGTSGCTSDDDCGTGLACLGGVCVIQGVGDTCTTSADCEGDLICFNSRCALPGVGEGCTSDDECAADLVCFESQCRPEGGDCSDQVACGDGFICRDQFCAEDPFTPAQTDITGDWWMFRYQYDWLVEGNNPIPADIASVAFFQTDDVFDTIFEGEADVIPGFITDGVTYTHGTAPAQAVMQFSDENHGRGTFLEDGVITFEILLVRQGDPEWLLDSEWVIDGPDEEPVTFAFDGSSVTMTFRELEFAGTYAYDTAMLLPQFESLDGVSVTWSANNAAEMRIYHNGDDLSTEAFTLRPPGQVDPGDTTPPTVRRVLPVDQVDLVDLDSTLVAQFSEAVDPETINASTFVVRPLRPVDGVAYAEGESLPGEYTVDGTTVTYSPTRVGLYGYGTEYELTFTEGITD
ncbi:MAG: Ig-like domain-containing protein, partial [Phycisphaerales bacterium]|nr:Ig-like domain-containing protein [Phycisphaerales bacterium]